ncbi:unnamed protein product, partial [marine sediment metagenome]
MAGNNAALAGIFDEIADMLDLTGEIGYRVNAYRKVARVLRDLAEDVADLDAHDRLASVSGIGKSTAEKIREYLSSGKIQRREELAAKVPGTLLGLLEIRGMGPKKVAAAWKQLGVETVDDLKRAIDSGELAELPGMGAKSAEQIKRGLAFVEAAAGRVPLGLARPMAMILIEQVRAFSRVRRVEMAGSLRRGKETVGDVDILCVADAGSKVIKGE